MKKTNSTTTTIIVMLSIFLFASLVSTINLQNEIVTTQKALNYCELSLQETESNYFKLIKATKIFTDYMYYVSVAYGTFLDSADYSCRVCKVMIDADVNEFITESNKVFEAVKTFE